MFGIAEDLNQYGPVTMPDLPGFGGMDSFYKIGMKPSLDNLADYLAAFIELRYKRSKVTILAVSFGFVVVTRMLQRYPQLVGKVDLLVSAVGFSHRDDYTFSRSRYLFYRAIASVFSHRLSAAFFRNVVLHPAVLRTFYGRTHNAKNKFVGLSPEQQRSNMDFEVHLWRINDVRTHMLTSTIMLTLDNCQKRIDLPLWHIAVKADQYFDNAVVEQHMRIIFSDFFEVVAVLPNHGPSIISTKKEAAPFTPKKIRVQLAKAPAS